MAAHNRMSCRLSAGTKTGDRRCALDAFKCHGWGREDARAPSAEDCFQPLTESIGWPQKAATAPKSR
jgi:hypothetical protein